MLLCSSWQGYRNMLEESLLLSTGHKFFCSCQESNSKPLKDSVFFKPFPSGLRDLCRRGGGKIVSDSAGG